MVVHDAIAREQHVQAAEERVHGQNGETQDSRGGRIVVAAVGDAFAPYEIRIKTAADKVRQDRGKGDCGDKKSVDMLESVFHERLQNQGRKKRCN